MVLSRVLLGEMIKACQCQLGDLMTLQEPEGYDESTGRQQRFATVGFWDAAFGLHPFSDLIKERSRDAPGFGDGVGKVFGLLAMNEDGAARSLVGVLRQGAAAKGAPDAGLRADMGLKSADGKPVETDDDVMRVDLLAVGRPQDGGAIAYQTDSGTCWDGVVRADVLRRQGLRFAEPP